MPAAAFKVYGAALEAIMKDLISLSSDAFRMVLVTEAYTPDQATHATWSDASANEVADGDGYATHGLPVTIAITRSGLEVIVDCDDKVWAASTITAKYALIVMDANGDNALAGTDRLIAYSDLKGAAGSVSSTADNFTVNVPSGIFKPTAS